jgi:hypothetical protein
MANYKKPSLPKFRAVARRLSEKANAHALARVGQFAEQETTAFKKRIKDQDFRDFHAIPLSPVTLAAKRRAGVDLRVMIATKTYVNSIQVFRRKHDNGRGARFRIGFHPQKKARDNYGHIVDILLSDVARIQEYGSRAAKIPARKHWRPHLHDMRPRARAFRVELRDELIALLRAEIQRAV